MKKVYFLLREFLSISAHTEVLLGLIRPRTINMLQTRGSVDGLLTGDSRYGILCKPLSGTLRCE